MKEFDLCQETNKDYSACCKPIKDGCKPSFKNLDERLNLLQNHVDTIQKELQQLKARKLIDPAFTNLIVMTLLFLPVILYCIYSVVDYTLI